MPFSHQSKAMRVHYCLIGDSDTHTRTHTHTERERERDGGGGCRVSVVVLDRPGLHYLTAVGSTCCLLLRFVRLGSVAVVELELAAFCAILGVQLNTCVQQRFVAVVALR